MTNNPDGLSDARALDIDEARLALWQAIQAITYGNPTDDKLIVAELAKQGVYLARLATPPASTSTAIAAGQYEARFVAGGAPTDCVDYGVVSLAKGVEVCRVWQADDARLIADLLNAAAAPKAASDRHPGWTDAGHAWLDAGAPMAPKAASEDGATGLIEGVKRVLQNPDGEHDGWTDAGLKHVFFRWPSIVHAINAALASPTDATDATNPPAAGEVDAVRADACDIPPAGWWCSRKAGHEGPCAALAASPTDATGAGAMREAADARERQAALALATCHADALEEHGEPPSWREMARAVFAVTDLPVAGETL